MAQIRLRLLLCVSLLSTWATSTIAGVVLNTDNLLILPQWWRHRPHCLSEHVSSLLVGTSVHRVITVANVLLTCGTTIHKYRHLMRLLSTSQTQRTNQMGKRSQIPCIWLLLTIFSMVLIWGHRLNLINFAMFIGIYLSWKNESLYGTLHVLILKCIIGYWLLILKSLLLLSILYNALFISVSNIVIPFDFLSEIKLIRILMDRRRRVYLIINRWSFWRSYHGGFDLLYDVIWKWLILIMDPIGILFYIIIILLYVLCMNFNSILFSQIHFFNIIIYDQLSQWLTVLNRYLEPLIWLRSCLLKELICKLCLIQLSVVFIWGLGVV